MTVQVFKQKDKGRGSGHPIMFGMKEADYFGDFPDGGGYPRRFLEKAFEIMGVTDPEKVLHVCSGSMKIGITVDMRPEMHPKIVADARSLPFAADTFQWIMTDPPYSQEYAENLYGTGDAYPNPHSLCDECLRVLKPGGYLGFMHHIVPKFHKPGRLLKVYTITQGVGYNVRAWSLFTK